MISICDTGPLVAYLNRNDRHHRWASALMHWPRVRTLMARYEQMDLADACVVAMSELHARCQVLTVDRKGFSVYRRNDRQTIAFIAPPKR